MKCMTSENSPETQLHLPSLLFSIPFSVMTQAEDKRERRVVQAFVRSLLQKRSD